MSNAIVPFMTKEQMAVVMTTIFAECHPLREAGHAEYAGGPNAFGNFVRQALKQDQSPEKVLMTHFTKHLDGIEAWIGGHRSQREPVRGRIKDAIVYLCLLAGMVECREAEADAVVRTTPS